MEDEEFCRRYASIMVDSRLHHLHTLCEAYVRICMSWKSGEDLAVEITKAVRSSENSSEAFDRIHTILKAMI